MYGFWSELKDKSSQAVHLMTKHSAICLHTLFIFRILASVMFIKSVSSQSIGKGGPFLRTNIILMLGNEPISSKVKSRSCLRPQSAVQETLLLCVHS